MAKDIKQRSWQADQIMKSEFFHQKIHAWELLEIVDALLALPVAQWGWDLPTLGISPEAWQIVIHSPRLTPVLVFAHPKALQTLAGAVRYYRMLAMVSQKSMQHIGLPVFRFEEHHSTPDERTAQDLAVHFNRIISVLVAHDAHAGNLSWEETFLWRGMAAGAQAQGSWQNAKGARVEHLLRERIVQFVHARGGNCDEKACYFGETEIKFASEPDIAVWQGNEMLAAVEIKGGIDAAGVLERLGAAVKSLQRVKDAYPAAVTILVLAGASLTRQAEEDLHRQRFAVNIWYLLEDLLLDRQVWQEFVRKIRLR